MNTYLVSEEVLRQVLDALEDTVVELPQQKAIDALRAILSKPPREPVAWKWDTGEIRRHDNSMFPTTTIALYRKDA